ncbi:nicotinate-nucleotide adenylyltransferase [Geminocystis herdmanii]|uniref:nicotinate-nucleotide adenylyltransferase n=1 Tax=Geminocystis herdmanii TaxID=669359 RepID=UPI0003468067|nr:nicotinate-nucleotide adenylyltransferase [Geminocystis herdmanii]
MFVALFGTSADPPTIAHKSILCYLSQNYDLVGVYASDNPFKSHGCALLDRTKMLELLIQDIKLSNIVNCQDISDRRTINTVVKAREKWGEDIDLTMVIGGDLAQQIFTWYEAEKLWRQVKVLLIPREGYRIEQETIDHIISRSLGCSIAPCEIPPFSSTDYRYNHDSAVLTDKVKSYIHKNRLYLNDESSC